MSFFKFRRIFAAVVFAASAICATEAAAQQLNDEDRDRYINEIRTYKHDFLTRDLNLSREQQKEFFTLYDEMDEKLQQLNTETRDLERQVDTDSDASATEIEAAARAVFEQTVKEGNIELEYFEKFSKVLTPRQLLKLKSSEKKFTQLLVRQHRRGPADRMKKKTD